MIPKEEYDLRKIIFDEADEINERYYKLEDEFFRILGEIEDELKKDPDKQDPDYLERLKNEKSASGNLYFSALCEKRVLEEYLNNFSDRNHISSHFLHGPEFGVYARTEKSEDRLLIPCGIDDIEAMINEDPEIHLIYYKNYKAAFNNKMNTIIEIFESVSGMTAQKKRDTMKKIAYDFFSKEEAAKQAFAEAKKGKRKKT